jgi:hypothetical protein
MTGYTHHLFTTLVHRLPNRLQCITYNHSGDYKIESAVSSNLQLLAMLPFRPGMSMRRSCSRLLPWQRREGVSRRRQLVRQH